MLASFLVALDMLDASAATRFGETTPQPEM
jgi:hypothetical protein